MDFVLRPFFYQTQWFALVVGLTLGSGALRQSNTALSPILGYTDLRLASPDARADSSRLLEELTIINTAAKDAANGAAGLRGRVRKAPERSSSPI